jgi:hypothetical protein
MQSLHGNWPIVTDDNFEDALPNYELSKKGFILIEPLKRGQGYFVGRFLRGTAKRTNNLGQGGSDLTLSSRLAF